MAATIILDAGHGGYDNGASYQGRKEKDDTLRVTLAVGQKLEDAGYNVLYTRTMDRYDSPIEKANIANRSGADYFISIHRNAMPVPGTASGVETLVYENSGVPALLAQNINSALSDTGFTNLGINERPGLVVLRRTEMPAVLVEAGFIDNEADNRLFDQNFPAIAQAIANGILTTIRQEEQSHPEYYQVQTGVYQNQQTAQQQVNQLTTQGFPAFMIYDNGVYKVRVGAFLNMDNAVRMEQQLKNNGYNTFLVREMGV